MSRCRETSGILFKHQCRGVSEAQCMNCGKPVCASHFRAFQYGTVCVTCVRTQLKNPSMRGSFAHLRDDPYFYWYYRSETWLSDPYGADDYALFDGDDPPDFDARGPDPWAGS